MSSWPGLTQPSTSCGARQKDVDGRDKPGHDAERMCMTAKELDGKVAIVTGAGRNIGRAIALALASDGASILVNARSNRAEADGVAREIEAAGGKAIVHIGDIADAAQVHAMVELAARHFG